MSAFKTIVRAVRFVGAPISAAALLALGQCGPAQAATTDYNFAFDASKLSCGVFGLSEICAESQSAGAPIATVAGDQFNIHVTSSAPIVVPGSSAQSILFADAYDATATLGPGGPGALTNTYTSAPIGFSSAPGAPPPITGPFSVARTYDYIGYTGYCCGYGVPTTGFSVTGVNMDLTVGSADSHPIVGYSVGYVYQLAALPTTLSDLPGGTVDNAVLLPSGLISSINGSIGGPGGPTEQFYNFNWNGNGVFEVNASVDGSDSGDFTFELFNPDGSIHTSYELDGANGFSHLFTETDLVAGNYEIGLVAHGAEDPDFTFTFDTPIGSAGVPEPATWAMMLVGFGSLGAVLRRRRKLVWA